MYDVALDYLINFRFKLHETPPLLGYAYPLDKNSCSQYEKKLTRAYADLHSGITLEGIHTSRFNIFYFTGEGQLVVMLFKRIILDHQPMLKIKQVQKYIRDPPFYVEYNTKLISDESIAVALSKLVFKETQLRLIIPFSKISLVDLLYDPSSTLID
jgi:hypothetical protein